MHYASENGDITLIKALIQAGAHVNAISKNKLAFTPLASAIYYMIMNDLACSNYENVIELLMINRADVSSLAILDQYFKPSILENEIAEVKELITIITAQTQKEQQEVYSEDISKESEESSNENLQGRESTSKSSSSSQANDQIEFTDQSTTNNTSHHNSALIFTSSYEPIELALFDPLKYSYQDSINSEKQVYEDIIKEIAEALLANVASFYSYLVQESDTNDDSLILGLLKNSFYPELISNIQRANIPLPFAINSDQLILGNLKFEPMLEFNFKINAEASY